MLAARDIIVCLAFFAVMYGTLASLVGAAWWIGCRLWSGKTVTNPNLLFGLRILPFALSALVSIFFTFPSFWLMERRSLDEEGSTFFLAACALILLSAGFVRAARATRLTKCRTAQWLSRSAENSDAGTVRTNSAAGAPALVLAGVWHPKVMVSDMAAAVLTKNELRVAIRHEMAHKRAWDNLKKLLLNAAPCPGMGGIERAWRAAAELAADDSAVETRQDALDLAAALIKLSRSARQWREPQVASSLVCGSSAVATRIHRLLQWRPTSQGHKAWPWAVLAGLVLTAIAANYGAALVMTHQLTELLVP